MREGPAEDPPLGPLLAAAKEGDAEATKSLLVAFAPLVHGLSRRLSGPDRFLREDLAQEGYLAICRAILAHRPDRGPFPAFAKACVRNRMVSVLRSLPRERLREDPREAGIAVLEPDLSAIERSDALDRLLKELSDAERRALFAYLEAGSVRAAAERLGWERKRLSNALDRIRGKARRREA